MNRTELAAWWDDAWDKGLWCTPWSKSLDDLSAQEAAWKPAPGRHSVWQIVEHMIFWREYAVGRLAKEAGVGTVESIYPLPDEEVQRRNFPEPKETSENAWRSTRDRFAASHKKVREALLNPSYATDYLRDALPHDHYHLGQIMYVRAMMGKKAIG